MKLLLMAVAVFACLLGAVLDADATQVTYLGSDGGTRSADATFAVVSGDLRLTLRNTSLFDLTVQSELLSGIFWDMTGGPVLSPVAAALGIGSQAVMYDGSGEVAVSTDPGGVVGGEFGFHGSIVSAGIGGYGVNANGVGSFFGAGNRFPGSNLEGVVSPNGANFGITSASDDLSTYNGNQFLDLPVIRNSVVFTLAGALDGFDLETGISNIRFQYGTSLSDPSFPGIPGGDEDGAPPAIAHMPEPGTLVLLGLGALGLFGAAYRRKRK